MTTINIATTFIDCDELKQSFDSYISRLNGSMAKFSDEIISQDHECKFRQLMPIHSITNVVDIGLVEKSFPPIKISNAAQISSFFIQPSLSMVTKSRTFTCYHSTSFIRFSNIESELNILSNDVNHKYYFSIEYGEYYQTLHASTYKKIKTIFFNEPLCLSSYFPSFMKHVLSVALSIIYNDCLFRITGNHPTNIILSNTSSKSMIHMLMIAKIHICTLPSWSIFQPIFIPLYSISQQQISPSTHHLYDFYTTINYRIKICASLTNSILLNSYFPKPLLNCLMSLKYFQSSFLFSQNTSFTESLPNLDSNISTCSLVSIYSNHFSLENKKNEEEQFQNHTENDYVLEKIVRNDKFDKNTIEISMDKNIHIEDGLEIFRIEKKFIKEQLELEIEDFFNRVAKECLVVLLTLLLKFRKKTEKKSHNDKNKIDGKLRDKTNIRNIFMSSRKMKKNKNSYKNIGNTEINDSDLLNRNILFRERQRLSEITRRINNLNNNNEQKYQSIFHKSKLKFCSQKNNIETMLQNPVSHTTFNNDLCSMNNHRPRRSRNIFEQINYKVNCQALKNNEKVSNFLEHYQLTQ